MSQKKVDAYKARKGQHSKADKKEKMLFGLEMFAWAFICVVIVAWIGYSAYAKVTGAKENALDNYISNMTTDTTDDADSTDADTTDADAEDTTASEDTDSEDTVTDDTATDTEETADDKESTDDTASTDDAETESTDSASTDSTDAE